MSEPSALLPLTHRGIILVVVNSFVSLLVIVFVALRTLRNIKCKRFGWDEPLIILAALILLATVGVSISSVPYGLGRHVYQFPNGRLSHQVLQLPWLSQPLAAAALLVAKASLAVTLLQIGLGRTFNVIVVTALGIVSVADIWSIIQIVTGCNPRAWPVIRPCKQTRVAVGGAFFQCSANIMVDLVYFFAPEFFLRKTQLNPRDRLAIRVLLAFIFAATVMSVVKLYYLQILLRTGDITYNSVPVSCGSVAEAGLSIVAACLPAVRQLAGNRFPRGWRFWISQSTADRSAAGSPRPNGQKGYMRDVERAHSRPGYAPPYSSRDIKIMSDVKFLEEDDDGVELISHPSRPPGSARVTDFRALHAHGASSSASTRGASPVSPDSPLLPPMVQQIADTGSLEGRMSSRYRAPDAAEHGGPSNRAENSSTTHHFKSGEEKIAVLPATARIPRLGPSPIFDKGRSISPFEMGRGTPSRGSNSSIRGHAIQVAHKTSSTSLSHAQQPNLNGSGRATGEGPVVPLHYSTGSMDTVSTSFAETPLPSPPFYYENNKIRRSARPSLEQLQPQPSQQPHQDGLYDSGSVGSTNKGYHSHSGSAASWLNATPRPL